MSIQHPNPDAMGFGVYVHWPFCAAKCPYCDFNSHVRVGGIDDSWFVEAYRTDIERTRQRIGPRQVTSIFFGGGTPSMMAATTLNEILAAIDKAWSIAPDAEITLEANPTSVETGRFHAYRKSGVNRLSLGIQALNDTDLEALGRRHSALEARQALDIALATFGRVSFDLIYARPRQSEKSWEKELLSAIALGPQHLSLYQLTIEEGTPFARRHSAGMLHIPPPKLADALFCLTQNITENHGLPAYEISNHAARGEESRHNLLYWRYGEYAGIGPGAHGRLIVDGQRRATTSEALPERWRDRTLDTGTGVTTDTALTRQEQADELLLMGLRTSEGINLDRLAKIGGVRPSPQTIQMLEDSGHLEHLPNQNRIRCTPRGRIILNALILELAANAIPA
ncbi:MAG: radical SAM family heme chaperone HemW [Hyphomicrobiaceae bacterium]